MFEINNFVTAGKFFLIIAGELVLIFVAVSSCGNVDGVPSPITHTGFLSNRLTCTVLTGLRLGAVTPFCSCSTVPITAGLLKEEFLSGLLCPSSLLHRFSIRS